MAESLTDYRPSIPLIRRKTIERLDDLFRSGGCSSYVKTIYVGYEIDSEMVAAVYGHAKFVEVALSLAEDRESDLLHDANHLTWRTLPKCLRLFSLEEVSEAEHLLLEAINRVRGGLHNVCRDNDFYALRRELLNENNQLP